MASISSSGLARDNFEDDADGFDDDAGFDEFDEFEDDFYADDDFNNGSDNGNDQHQQQQAEQTTLSMDLIDDDDENAIQEETAKQAAIDLEEEKVMKRQVKLRQVELHRLHLLTLLARCTVLNEQCDLPDLQQTALRGMPQRVRELLCKVTKENLGILIGWVAQALEVAGDEAMRRSRTSIEQTRDLRTKSEQHCNDVTLLRQCVINLRVNRHKHQQLVQVIAVVLRGLGLACRLVFPLNVTPKRLALVEYNNTSGSDFNSSVADHVLQQGWLECLVSSQERKKQSKGPDLLEWMAVVPVIKAGSSSVCITVTKSFQDVYKNCMVQCAVGADRNNRIPAIVSPVSTQQSVSLPVAESGSNGEVIIDLTATTSTSEQHVHQNKRKRNRIENNESRSQAVDSRISYHHRDKKRKKRKLNVKWAPYVIALAQGSYIADVTNKYLPAQHAASSRSNASSVLLQYRLPMLDTWWRKAVIDGLRTRANEWLSDNASDMDAVYVVAIDECFSIISDAGIEEEEGGTSEDNGNTKLPTTLEGIKAHRDFTMTRLLPLSKSLRPNAKPVGFCGGDPVYAVADVFKLHSKYKWRLLGKNVIQLELDKPARTIAKNTRSTKHMHAKTSQTVNPTRDRNIGSSTDKENSFQELSSANVVALYGPWQTEQIEVGQVGEDGRIPRNEYDNVEMLSLALLPKGAVHVSAKTVPFAAKACKAIGVDAAPALVGFERRGLVGNYVPTFDGVVVAAFNEAVVVEAAAALDVQHQTKLKATRSTLVVGKWESLVRALRISARLKARYGGATSVTAAGDVSVDIDASSPGVVAGVADVTMQRDNTTVHAQAHANHKDSGDVLVRRGAVNVCAHLYDTVGIIGMDGKVEEQMEEGEEEDDDDDGCKMFRQKCRRCGFTRDVELM